MADSESAPASGSAAIAARLAGVVILLGSFWMASSEWPFSTRGTVVQARVTGLHESFSRGHYYYYPEYELLASLKDNACRSFSSSWFWSKPRVADIVPVLYYVDAGRLHCEPGGFLDRWLLPFLAGLAGAALLVRGRPVSA